MENENKIPCFDLFINENEKVMDYISFVLDPATEVPMFAFSKDNSNFIQCRALDEMEHKVLCCLMRANFKILRLNENGEKFYINFTPEALEVMGKKIIEHGSLIGFNQEHRGDKIINDIDILDIFQKNTDLGINPIGYDICENGSLFAILKINNENLWQQILNGDVMSVSIEGVYTKEAHKETEAEHWEYVKQEVKKYLKSLK